jgi:hypothetical protein
MTSGKKSDGAKGPDRNDTEESLQNELSREAKEGADSIGDLGSNRTLSGSSSWETLPDSHSAESKSKSGKDSGQSHEAPNPGNKPR